VTVVAPASTARLTAGTGRDTSSLEQHLHEHGEAPAIAAPARAELIAAVAASGLRGRGGAAFDTATKLAAVERSGASAVVVVNGAEGEPASAKDRWLLVKSPHLVLDGALLAAQAVAATDVIVCIRESAVAAHESVAVAVAERESARTLPAAVQILATPDTYLAGEESALVRYVNGGPAKPTFVPPRPFARGVARRPTLVQNVETLAQLALIARYGASWFRQLGTAEEPGTALVTLSGAVSEPGVYEIAFGTPLRELVRAARGTVEPVRAVLVGGYFGTWIDALAARDVALDERHLAPLGAALGSGVIGVLGESACGVAETANIVSYLARESAGQCGPCTYGLGAIAEGIEAIRRGDAEPAIEERLTRWSAVVSGRGACHHPDGAVRLALSGLEVFREEFADHRRGGACARCDGPPFLPIPDRSAGARRRR
jgi:NADH:ubiquinone oxidoreductase subunit F (NADH-binding)